MSHLPNRPAAHLRISPRRGAPVDCFSDRERGLLYAGPRERIRTRAGIAMHTTFVDDAELQAWATHIAKRLTFHSTGSFKRSNGRRSSDYWKSPVLPALFPHAHWGVNLPLLSLYEAERAGQLASQRRQPPARSVPLESLPTRFRVRHGLRRPRRHAPLSRGRPSAAGRFSLPMPEPRDTIDLIDSTSRGDRRHARQASPAVVVRRSHPPSATHERAA